MRTRVALVLGPAAFLALGLTLGGLSCDGSSDDAPPVESPARVRGGFIRDDDGRALLLRGVNLAGAHKSAPYFSFHQPADFARVRDDWGMSTVRFLITWAAVEPERGVFDEAYLDALAERMDWARDAGLFVVLDMHQDVYGEGFVSGGGDGAPRWTCDESHYAAFEPNPSQWFFNYLSPEVLACYDQFWSSTDLRAEYAEAWRHVATRLEGYDDVILGFDPMNEPYWGSYVITGFEESVLQGFYEELVPKIREIRPKWIAFLEPASSRNLGVRTGLTKMPFADVVYAPHSYDRDAESGMGFDPAQRDVVLANARDLAGEASALGAGLWIGEYGGMADAPGIVEYMTAEYDAFGATAAGTTYWAYDEGGGYSMLDADGTEREPLVSTLIRPWPERVAGDPVSYAFDAATSTFTLTYRPDRSIAAPTVISIPPRVYPDGFTVECDGCASTAIQGALEITTPPRGDDAVVTLVPSGG
ncbi:MAG TPA: cellulase family glycosylhydrolase [Polyangiaceae bacterium]|nr:cellulase family glycosylhydrolase [Polyangiaceae bacterium]